MLAPVRQDLNIYQGQDFSRTFVINGDEGLPLDMTGYKAAMAIRTGVRGAQEAFLSTDDATHGGTITCGSDGKLVITMTNDRTAAVGWTLLDFMFWGGFADIPLQELGDNVGRPFYWRDLPFRYKRRDVYHAVYYQYDLCTTSPSGFVSRPFEGIITFRRVITQPSGTLGP